MAIGIPYLIAAIAIVGVREPASAPSSSGRLLPDAWEGLRYVWGNRSLRGLGFSISTLNISGGMATIVVPLIVLEHLGGSEAMVGLVFALSGVAGVVSVVVSGRIDSRRREWRLLVLPMIPMAPVHPAAARRGGRDRSGPGLRRARGMPRHPRTAERTHGHRAVHDAPATHGPGPAGRAFAVSMAFNFLGYPVGAAIAGALATTSIDAAIWLGVGACALAVVFAAIMVPRQDAAADDLRTAGRRSGSGRHDRRGARLGTDS